MNPSYKFKRLLKPRETPRGVPTMFEIYATNIGDTTTPASKTSRFLVEATNVTWSYPNFTVPQLEPKKRTLVHKLRHSPTEEGVTWLNISIDPVNNEPFHYYDRPEAEPRADAWKGVFYVINREMLNLIVLLKMLVK